jgi:hypothetical protein
MKNILFALVAFSIAGAAMAKLPAPSDEAKAKAAETQAKAAHGTKVAAYQLCLSQDKVAAKFADKARAVPAEPCANPGPFVPAIAVVPAAVPAAAPVVTSATAVAPVVAVKK